MMARRKVFDEVGEWRKRKNRKRYLVSEEIVVPQYQSIGVALRLPHPDLVTLCTRCWREAPYSAARVCCQACEGKLLSGVFARDKPERDEVRQRMAARKAA